MGRSKNKELPFEEALKNLEGIVTELENGEITLDILLEKYTQGVVLSKLCLDQLDHAEQVIDKMVQESKGKIYETALNIEGE